MTNPSAFVGTQISVIIPAFNAAKFIDPALESVMSQTLKATQVIVVDDGSTDDTARRCESWAPHVQLISQQNSGPGRARNVGVAASTGALLGFLDADDLWLPDKLERQVAHLDANPSVVAVFGWMQNFVDPDAHLTVGPRTPLDPRPAYQAPTMLARRSVMDTVGMFDEIGPMQGWTDWFLRLRESGLPIGMVNELVLRRRIHGANMTLRNPADFSEYHRFLLASIQRRRKRDSDAG